MFDTCSTRYDYQMVATSNNDSNNNDNEHPITISMNPVATITYAHYTY